MQDNRQRVWGPFARGGKGARAKITLPNNAALRGQKIYWQNIVVDSKANTLGVVLSDAIELTLQ